MTDAIRTGVVLAGGYSTRFGERDKALADVDGEPMVARVADRLAAAVDAVVVNCRADQRARFERAVAGRVDAPVTFAIDDVEDAGPLAGLRRALADVESEYAAAVACDMPALDPALVRYLFDRAAGHDAAIPRLRDGTRQPAQAVYRVDAILEGADRQLEAGRRSLRGALDRLDAVHVPTAAIAAHANPRSLRDVNTREDLDAFVGATDGTLAGRD